MDLLLCYNKTDRIGMQSGNAPRQRESGSGPSLSEECFIGSQYPRSNDRAARPGAACRQCRTWNALGVRVRPRAVSFFPFFFVFFSSTHCSNAGGKVQWYKTTPASWHRMNPRPWTIVLNRGALLMYDGIIGFPTQNRRSWNWLDTMVLWLRRAATGWR